MKKQLLGFLTGVIVSALIFTTVPALAAQIQTITASINTVNIALDGKQVAAKGESYMLDNGTQVPYSLSYNGTTYLPMRKVGELVGKDIYWDATTGTAGVGKEPAAQTPTAPDTTVANDYSNWTAEEEAAYQEFKGMWEVEARPASATLTCNSSNSVLSTFLLKYTDEALLSYIRRLDTMIYDNEIEPTPTTVVIMSYVTTNGDGLWDDICDQVPFKYGFNTSRVGSNFSLERVLQKLNT